MDQDRRYDGYLMFEEQKLVHGAQFQPREFSAIIGADICCVRAELPALRPLPLLFLSLLVPPGDTRPPDMSWFAPPKSAGLPDCLISALLIIELDRR